MPEKGWHTCLKDAAAELLEGNVECKVLTGRLDACNVDVAVEVELSGRRDRLERAIDKLRMDDRKEKWLVVPMSDVPAARNLSDASKIQLIPAELLPCSVPEGRISQKPASRPTLLEIVTA
jgi:hypothetical protein